MDKRSTPEIDANNLAIFMSDSLRWDSRPTTITSMGLTLKTVASSFFTPPSHASMLTGLYPHHHGISGFFERLPPQLGTILDDFPNSGLSDIRGHFDDALQGSYFNQAIYETLLDRYEPRPLSDMEEPFGWFMRDPGGHAPYGGWDSSMNVSESVPKFFKRYAGDEEALRRQYELGIESSINRFKQYVLEPLSDRGILDNTLIIFLSDHGEQMGEHGHCGQSIPATPEVVYVPTTMIHPDLPNEELDQLFRHVDLPNTIRGLMDLGVQSQDDGVNALEHPPEWGFSLINRSFPSFVGTFDYEIRSIWDSEGGYVLNPSPLWNKFKYTGGYLTKIPSGTHLRRRPNVRGFKLLFEKRRVWGDPTISPGFAYDKLAQIDQKKSPEALGQTDEATRQHLEEMGYL